MAFMDWKEEFSVNILQFDTQHQALFKLIDNLNDAMKLGKGNAVLGNILHELETYTITHFKDEEQYLVQNNYPKLQQQISEHTIFTDAIAGFRHDLEVKQIGLSIKVINFLKDWLQNHIKVKDKEYGEFLTDPNRT